MHLLLEAQRGGRVTATHFWRILPIPLGIAERFLNFFCQSWTWGIKTVFGHLLFKNKQVEQWMSHVWMLLHWVKLLTSFIPYTIVRADRLGLGLTVPALVQWWSLALHHFHLQNVLCSFRAKHSVLWMDGGRLWHSSTPVSGRNQKNTCVNTQNKGAPRLLLVHTNKWGAHT